MPDALLTMQEPSAAEIDATRRSGFRAVIGQNLGTPTAEVAAQIPSMDGTPLLPEQLFVVPGQPSNSNPDYYFTFQTPQTLANYAADATEGRALMIAHDYDTLPIGQSYAATVEDDPAPATSPLVPTEITDERRARARQLARAWAARQAQRAKAGQRDDIVISLDDLLGDDDWDDDWDDDCWDDWPVPVEGVSPWEILARYPQPLSRLCVNYYIVRGLATGPVPNDTVIEGIRTRTLRDLSIGFMAGWYRCVICGRDSMSWDCWHIPGLVYDTPTGPQVALAAVEDGHLLETSLAYKGACPDAALVPVKARMVATAGRLSPMEAQGLTALETRLGQRLLAPEFYRRAATVFPFPARPTKEQRSMATTPRTPAPPARRDTQTQPAAPPVGDPSTQPAQDIGTTYEDQAQALADQITAEQNTIAGLQAQKQGIDDQTTALQNDTATDANGAPVDHTDQIAGLQAQSAALQTQIDAETATLTALQAELDTLNQAASANGGNPATPAPADASGGTGGMAGAQGAKAPAVTRAGRARAALSQMRGMFAQYVAPILPGIRALASTDFDAIIAEVQQLLTDLQNLQTQAGTNVARSAADTVIFGMLQRAVPNAQVNAATVRALLQNATAGERYRTRLIDDCVAVRVRAFGAASVDEAHYRAMLRALDVTGLETELAGYSGPVQAAFQPGRSVIPAGQPAHLEPQGGPAPTGVFDVRAGQKGW